MGIITLSALLIAGTGFYLFSKSFPGFRAGIKKLQSDLGKLTAILDTINVELIPVNSKELEALSTSQVESSSKGRGAKNSKGAFVSIFEEPLIKYAYKGYGRNNADMVMMAMAGKHRYAYLGKGNKVQIVVDEQVLGTYDPEAGILSGKRTQKPVAVLDRSRPEQNLISIRGKEVASMHKLHATASQGLSKRVFEYVVDQLTAEEQVALIAIVIYELVQFTN